jgi:hypothetical protein
MIAFEEEAIRVELDDLLRHGRKFSFSRSIPISFHRLHTAARIRRRKVQ